MDSLRGHLQAMTTSGDLTALLKNVLAEFGFAKHGQVWVRRSGELVWIIQLERSPYGKRFSLDIGVQEPADEPEPMSDADRTAALALLRDPGRRCGAVQSRSSRSVDRDGLAPSASTQNGSATTTAPPAPHVSDPACAKRWPHAADTFVVAPKGIRLWTFPGSGGVLFAELVE